MTTTTIHQKILILSILLTTTTTHSHKSSPSSSECQSQPQSNLRYNISSFTAQSAGLYNFAQDPTESLVNLVCCDPLYVGYAEPRYFYSRSDVNFFHDFDHNNLNKQQQTYYDPICGIPLFVAPRNNRTVQDFMKDTEQHGWPSFRMGEEVEGNVMVDHRDGRTVRSKCGTRLGTLEPVDDEEDDTDGVRVMRYCLDVACISGNPVKDDDDFTGENIPVADETHDVYYDLWKYRMRVIVLLLYNPLLGLAQLFLR